MATFYVGAGDLTSGPQACTAGPLNTEPSYQPLENAKKYRVLLALSCEQGHELSLFITAAILSGWLSELKVRFFLTTLDQ